MWNTVQKKKKNESTSPQSVYTLLYSVVSRDTFFEEVHKLDVSCQSVMHSNFYCNDLDPPFHGYFYPFYFPEVGLCTNDGAH